MISALNRMLSARRAYLLASTALACWYSPSHAQSADPDTIIVMADRLGSRTIQDAPLSITIFSAQEIRDAGVYKTEDFVNLTPNLVLDNGFTALNTNGLFRGLSQLNNGDAPYAVIVDGVPQNDLRQFNMELVDIDQIEIAAGPQGALYGRNAVAGAIIITTTKPSRDDWEGTALAGYGQGDQARLQVSVGGPLKSVSDRLFLRLSGSFLSDNGRQENVFLGENADFVKHDATLRTRLLFEATANLRFDGKFEYRDFNRGGSMESLIPSEDANDFQQPSSNRLGRSKGSVLNGTFKAEAEFSPFVLTLISGYSKVSEDNRGDLDFSDPVTNPDGAFGFGHAAQFFTYDARILSQEARLTFTRGERLVAHIGASILDTDIDFPACLVVDDGRPMDELATDCTPANIVFFQDVRNRNFAYGFYAQANYAVTDNFGLELAVRYDEDDREQTSCAFNDRSNCDVLTDTFEGLQPKATVNYRIGNVLTYATFGRAYRSGGFNSPFVPPYQSEQTDTFELGFKSTWLNDRLRLNAVAFYSSVDDYQFFFLENFAQRIANIEEARIFGIEVEARAQPTEWLNVYAVLGATDTEALESSLFPEFEGNTLPRTVDYTLNLGAQVRQPISADTALFARVDFERRGDRTWFIDNADVQEPIAVLNARVGMEWGAYGAYFYGRNLTDEQFYVDFFSRDVSGRLDALGQLNEPRFYGVELRASF